MKKLIVLAMLAMACGSKAPETKQEPAKRAMPTAAEAKQLIADAPEFGDYQFTDAAVSIPTARSAMNEPQRKNADALVKGGWLKWQGDTLALKKTDDKRFLMRPNGIVDVVPLAKKEFGEVEAVNGENVDFTWHWIANDVGKALQFHEGEQRATATLYWEGSKWGILHITPASAPAS